jgi:NTE family protein
MSTEIKYPVKRHYPVGYALSGGFIKGFAHLGVMQALLEHNIRPDIFSAVSAGAVSAAFVADGNEPYKVLDYFKDKRFKDLTRLVVPKRGLFEMTDFTEFLRENIKAKKIQDLKIPLIINATDLDNGKSVSFTRGNLAERIAASCCLPILFAPVCINGIHYVDGGIFSNLPVSVIRNVCDKVVAVNVSALAPEGYKLNIMGIAMRAYHLMFSSNSLHEKDNADLFIEPYNLTGYSNRKLEKAEEIFNQGYRTTNTYLNALLAEKGTIWK